MHSFNLASSRNITTGVNSTNLNYLERNPVNINHSSFWTDLRIGKTLFPKYKHLQTQENVSIMHAARQKLLPKIWYHIIHFKKNNYFSKRDTCSLNVYLLPKFLTVDGGV